MFKQFFEDVVEVPDAYAQFVDEGLVLTSIATAAAASLLTTCDVVVRVFDGGPDTWASVTGRTSVVGR